MEEPSKTQETVDELELRLAQEALQKAQQKVAAAEKMKLDAAAAAIAEHRAAEERKLAEAKSESEAIQRKWAERRAAEEAARVAAQQAKLAEERRLEMEAARAEEVIRKRNEHEANLRKIAEAEHIAEQTAAALLSDLNKPAVIPEEVERRNSIAPQSTVNSDTDGRLRLFARSVEEQAERITPQAPAAPQEMPSKYLVVNGRFSPEAFAELIADKQFSFFVSPSTSELCTGTTRWLLEGIVSNRIWTDRCKCVIEQSANGAYTLRKVGTNFTNPVNAVGVDPGFVPVPAQEVPGV